MSIEVHPVRSNSDLKRFIKIPWRIYKGNSCWVPPLIGDQKKKFNPDKNPFYQHSKVELFWAEKDGRPAGRIAAIVNNNYNEFHGENIGFWGCFECIDEQNVANSLFESAADYLKTHNLDLMRGPANFSSNDDWGLLIHGFEKPPLVMMPYNPPYYIDLLHRFGFNKAMDLFAFWLHKEQMTERIIRTAELIKKRTQVTFRHIDIKNFSEEIERIRIVYNFAWSRNWGFVPMTKQEFDHISQDLKQIVVPELVLIAEHNGTPVGFSLALPDINQALIHINGRLFPFGLFKLLYYAKRIHTVRVLTMGVVPEYQKRGIDVVFYYETFKRGTAKGFTEGELSWVLEANDMMVRAAENMGSKVYKKYRLYDFPLK